MRTCATRAARYVLAALLLIPPLPVRAQIPSVAPAREWTFPGGVATSAALQSFDGKTAVLRLPNGQRTSVPADSLGEPDRAYLSEWQEQQPAVMPDSVGVDSAKVQIEVVSEDEASGKYVYRTQHFEFTCDGKLTQNLLRDVARNFEATYELLKALPWGINPKPEEGDRFRALLVRSPQRYKEEGGPENSSGVYFGSRKVFVVPFESLGIERLGKSFAKASDYRSDTLVHELTHQMMHARLDVLPPWVVEGTAEYTNILPLRLGVFRVSAARSGLKDYLAFLKARGGVPEPYPVEELFNASQKQWAETLKRNPKESGRMYFTSYLLVNFFMNLDGKGNGARFVKYMRAIGKALEEVEKFQSDLEAFKKLPGVEVLPDGKYRWPDTLTPPTPPEIMTSPEKLAEFEKSTLDILLDGRKPSELMEQIRSAYRRAGIRL
ncbi:MAG: hypothetical protein NTV93_00370 [Verrucomicrobia bacterium]|nr:hypothetical protein [Verrucomicrobiota bacterium]